MKLNEYQKKAFSNVIFPNNSSIVYPTLGLNGEAGEVAEKVKKVLRNKKGIFSDKDRKDIALELGDCLWYVSAIAKGINMTLEQIALLNINKINSRMVRDKLKGNGDKR